MARKPARRIHERRDFRYTHMMLNVRKLSTEKAPAKTAHALRRTMTEKSSRSNKAPDMYAWTGGSPTMAPYGTSTDDHHGETRA